MTKPKRQAKKPKARTIWVNEYSEGLIFRYFTSKAVADYYKEDRIACIEFREVLKKGKK